MIAGPGYVRELARGEGWNAGYRAAFRKCIDRGIREGYLKCLKDHGIKRKDAVNIPKDTWGDSFDPEVFDKEEEIRKAEERAKQDKIDKEQMERWSKESEKYLESILMSQ